MTAAPPKPLAAVQPAQPSTQHSAPPFAPEVIETDAFLGDANGASWTLAGFEKAWKQSLDAMAEALARPGARRAVLVLGIPAAGKSTLVATSKRPGDVILDEAKLVYGERREAALEVALASGLPVDVIWVDTPLSVCKSRNDKRAVNRRVPDAILEEADRLLRTHPPTTAEGINEVFRLSGEAPATMQSAGDARAGGAPVASGTRELGSC